MRFPYEKQFRFYLYHRNLEEITINDICHDVADLFNYLRHFNLSYQDQPQLDNIHEADIRDYFNMLQSKRSIKNTTYNKVLTHLNTYFSFLFSQRYTTTLPTLQLKGLHRQSLSQIPLNWCDNLANLLQNKQLSFYTRMVLLCSAHFFTVQEFMAPNFYKVLNKITLQPMEQAFLAEYTAAYAELRQLQECKDLFLKKRINLAAPRLSLPGLHKYLKADQKHAPFPLIPRELYRNAVCAYILHHQSLSDAELCHHLRLTPTSLNYYRQQAYLLTTTH